MQYCVSCGRQVFGPYDTWEKAYLFGISTFGFEGWRIWKKEEQLEKPEQTEGK